ncbi:unnamed protein product [Blepharisma stoltei]|uniref:Ribosomal protein L20 n=1 Tax=Blepharisma stoltei TaxID=1481888 RepID=A0AAU9JXV6_9CILI|nr:unnamed protein product [Blepharisma stoltei]
MGLCCGITKAKSLSNQENKIEKLTISFRSQNKNQRRLFWLSKARNAPQLNIEANQLYIKRQSWYRISKMSTGQWSLSKSELI